MSFLIRRHISVPIYCLAFLLFANNGVLIESFTEGEHYVRRERQVVPKTGRKLELDLNVRELTEIIIDKGISSEDDLSNRRSPQSQAIEWLLEEDEYEYPSDEMDFMSTLIQRYITVVFYYALEGDDWENQADYLNPETDVCDWFDGNAYKGNTCNEEGFLTVISLWWNNLSGFLPPEVGHLTNMTMFNVLGGTVGGTIPSEYGALKKLEIIAIGNNEIEGEIPDEFEELPVLKYSTFSINNGLTGYNKLCPLVYKGQLQGLAGDCDPDQIGSRRSNCACCTDCCDESLKRRTNEFCCFTKIKEEFGQFNAGECYNPYPSF